MQEALYDDYDVAAGVTLYAGSIVEVTDGVASPAGTTDSPDFHCFCEHYVNNAGGADGDVTVTLKYRSSWLFATESGDIAGYNAGDQLYAVDDQTVSNDADGPGDAEVRGKVGRVAHKVTSEFPTEVWVEIDGPLQYQA